MLQIKDFFLGIGIKWSKKEIFRYFKSFLSRVDHIYSFIYKNMIF